MGMKLLRMVIPASLLALTRPRTTHSWISFPNGLLGDSWIRAVLALLMTRATAVGPA